MARNRRKIFGDAFVAAAGLAGFEEASRVDDVSACGSVSALTTASPSLRARIAGPDNPNWMLNPATPAEWHAIVEAVAIGSEGDVASWSAKYGIAEHFDEASVGYDGILGAAVGVYAAGYDMRDPELSPVYGVFSDFPPTQLTCGARDLFLSNTVCVQRKMLDAGVTADLTVIEAMSHADYVGLPELPESHQVYGDVERFFDRHLAV